MTSKQGRRLLRTYYSHSHYPPRNPNVDQYYVRIRHDLAHHLQPVVLSFTATSLSSIAHYISAISLSPERQSKENEEVNHEHISSLVSRHQSLDDHSLRCSRWSHRARATWDTTHQKFHRHSTHQLAHHQADPHLAVDLSAQTDATRMQSLSSWSATHWRDLWSWRTELHSSRWHLQSKPVWSCLLLSTRASRMLSSWQLTHRHLAQSQLLPTDVWHRCAMPSSPEVLWQLSTMSQRHTHINIALCLWILMHCKFPLLHSIKHTDNITELRLRRPLAAIEHVVDW